MPPPLCAPPAFRYSLPADPEPARRFFRTIHSRDDFWNKSFDPAMFTIIVLSVAPLPLFESFECNYYSVLYHSSRISSHVSYRSAYREGANRDPVFFILLPLVIILTRTGNVSCCSQLHNTNLDPSIECI